MLPAGLEETWGSLLLEMLLAAARWKSAAPGAGASWQSRPRRPAEPELHNFSGNGEITRVRGGGEKQGFSTGATSPPRMRQVRDPHGASKDPDTRGLTGLVPSYTCTDWELP